MKLDRNLSIRGEGKYAIVNLRRMRDSEFLCALPIGAPDRLEEALDLLVRHGIVTYGAVGDSDEFFLIKLKDRHSKAALWAYAHSVRDHDPEFASEIEDMATRAGPDHPLCKDPD